MKKWMLFAGFFGLSLVMLYLRATWSVVGRWTVALITDAGIAYASLRLQTSDSAASAELKAMKDEVATLESQMAGIIGQAGAIGSINRQAGYG